jgi:hypothetical protein
MNLVRSHTDQRNSVDLVVGQSASSEGAALVRGQSLELVGRLRLIRVDGPKSPEPPAPANRDWHAVIPEAFSLQVGAQLIHQDPSLEASVSTTSKRLKVATQRIEGSPLGQPFDLTA